MTPRCQCGRQKKHILIFEEWYFTLNAIFKRTAFFSNAPLDLTLCQVVLGGGQLMITVGSVVMVVTVIGSCVQGKVGIYNKIQLKVYYLTKSNTI